MTNRNIPSPVDVEAPLVVPLAPEDDEDPFVGAEPWPLEDDDEGPVVVGEQTYDLHV